MSRRRVHTRRRHILHLAVSLFATAAIAAGAASATVLTQSSSIPRTSLAPTTPGPSVCGSSSLAGPSTPPSGAVTIPAGDNSSLTSSLAPNTTYWFAPGTHTIGTGQYSQFHAQAGDTFVGAPGAIISGQGDNNTAISAGASSANITVSYLTIENFTPPSSQAALGSSTSGSGGAPGWTFSHDTVTDNSPGAGIILGSNGTITDSCLSDNGQYGFQAYSTVDESSLTGGPSNLTVTNNEIAGNDTHGYPNCGCSGGAKFWKVDQAVVTGNYVHDNHSVGLWADTDDVGFNISNNYIAKNDDEGVMYEISYNANISDNAFVDNGWVKGPTNPGFPTGAIYISESGGDSRVPGYSSGALTISANTFTDNWSGVVLWESADRFCGSPNNTSTGTCTLVDPTVANINTCNETNLTGATPANPLYNDCRWETKNVSVENNTFAFNPANIPSCNGKSNSCGENGIFSQYGTSPSWSPYKGWAISDAITATRNNVFDYNTYEGAGTWLFMYHDQSTVLSYAQWQADGQDVHSTVGTTPPPPPPTSPPTTTPPPTTPPPTSPPLPPVKKPRNHFRCWGSGASGSYRITLHCWRRKSVLSGVQ